MWIITAWQCLSPEVTVKGFKNCCILNVVDGTYDDTLWSGSVDGGNVRSESEEDEGTCDDMLWSGSEDGGNVRSECEEDEGIAVKMQTVTLSGEGRQTVTCLVYSVYEINSKGRQTVTCFVYSVYEINSKISFLSSHFILVGCLRFG
jgi:hypothetical protein